jgi:(E)-4-hydroxy-3-methylbut-2-enyl-diphosphate synthase
MFRRIQTNKVMVGDVQIGHNNRVVIQSMTNTKTSNVVDTLSQIKTLVSLGCELVRVAILDWDDLKALTTIVKKAPCPIIADIHYNYEFAIKAILAGVKKIRINPGNIANREQLKQIVETAKKHKVAIRIGFNTGSWSKVNTIISEAKKYIKLFES